MFGCKVSFNDTADVQRRRQPPQTGEGDFNGLFSDHTLLVHDQFNTMKCSLKKYSQLAALAKSITADSSHKLTILVQQVTMKDAIKGDNEKWHEITKN